MRQQATERHDFASGVAPERHPEFRTEGILQPGCCHANDRNHTGVPQLQAASEYRRITRELALPQGVAENRDGGSAGMIIVGH